MPASWHRCGPPISCPIWLPDPDTERLHRLVARRNQIVRHRTRIKNEVHAILHPHLIPLCPHADLFGRAASG
jgi:transposase